MIGKIRAFKIWYSDRTEVGYTFEDWVRLPDKDIQYILLFYNKNEMGTFNRRSMSGDDYYGLTEEGKISHNFDDKTKVTGYIKFGKWTSDKNIQRINDEVEADEGEWIPNQTVCGEGKGILVDKI